ncbi:MAG: glycosyltransferase family 4 protein [Bacteroidota bacterium]
MIKLAIITTHPIQYNAPLFKHLTTRGLVKPIVFYTWPQAIESVNDVKFGRTIRWDIPLLEGYKWMPVDNVSKRPNSKSYVGIDNPGLFDKVVAVNPDIVLVYGWNFKSHLKLIRRLHGKIPVWFTGDSTLLNEHSRIKRLVRRAMLGWVYSYIDKALYVGKQNKDYFKTHGLKAEQLIYFPHAVDNKRFSNQDDELNIQALKWRREIGLASDDRVLMYTGKFESVKNLDFLIRAFKTLGRDLYPNRIKLLLVGDGLLKDDLVKQVSRDTTIRFLPFQNQSKMPLVYRLGDIFVLPSKSETWGLAVNEAMACGRPVLVSDKVGCAIDLVNKTTGRTFKSGDVSDFKIQLIELLNSDLKQMGYFAREFIQMWSFDKKCEAIENNI